MIDNRLKVRKLEEQIDFSLKLLSAFEDEKDKRKIQYYIYGLEYAKEIFKENK